MEAMLLQVDFLMSGLMVLKERIDATEALIAIDLDNRRNELVAFDLVRINTSSVGCKAPEGHCPWQCGCAQGLVLAQMHDGLCRVDAGSMLNLC